MPEKGRSYSIKNSAKEAWLLRAIASVSHTSFLSLVTTPFLHVHGLSGTLRGDNVILVPLANLLRNTFLRRPFSRLTPPEEPGASSTPESNLAEAGKVRTKPTLMRLTKRDQPNFAHLVFFGKQNWPRESHSMSRKRSRFFH